MEKEPVADFDELALLSEDYDPDCPADQYIARLIWLGRTLSGHPSIAGEFRKVIAHPYDSSQPKIIAALNEEGGYYSWKEIG